MDLFCSAAFLFKFLKFSVVGLSGVVVDFGTTYFFKDLAGTNKYLANTLGFSFAATSNFFLNRLWTFHSTDPQIAIQYFKFLLIAIIGLVINNITIYLLTDRLRFFKFYFSKLIATAIVVLWNFLMNYFFTFS